MPVELCRSLKVLYLHPAGAFGGASKSLIELFGVLRLVGVEGVVLTPKGSACAAFAAAGLEVKQVKGLSQFDNTRFGHYRGLRWIILLREIYFLPFSLLSLWQIRKEKFDLIHVNEITLLPLGLIAKWLLGIPMVLHVRSLQRSPGSGHRTRWVNYWLRKHADAVVAIDHTVAYSLEGGIPLQVVHNGIKIEPNILSPVSRQKKSGVESIVRVGFLGVLIPLKGIYELVEAIKIIKNRGIKVECLVAGENARDLSGLKSWALGKLGFAKNVRADLESFIDDNNLHNQIKLLGFIGDVRTLYPKLDILCFPSYLDAAGRPVFEAALYGVPSVVAINNPMPDALIHGVTGLAISQPTPVLIADAIQKLAQDVEYRQLLGRRAREWAIENFSIENSAATMHRTYRSLTSSATVLV
jgi:glycosyltransferase involved in cell wall biosynthesis